MKMKTGVRPHLFRVGLTLVFSAILSVALFACAGGQVVEDEKPATVEVTLEVPTEGVTEVAKKEVQEVRAAATATATATATPVPTPTATATATVTPREDRESETPQVDVPNRGYNTLGDPNAPITMFEFSDFT